MIKIPKHLSMTIEHNPHKAIYESVQSYIDNYEHLKTSVISEDLKICSERDEIWELRWYPATPTSFYIIISYSLERCLELANSEKYDH